ncbi:DNA-binding protein SMUBP-2-like [Amphiura filiformis]|uniref:DNA-binding protein SMUBP-2-like n=1 Tax=Amphiura filiformis TaxID=82378 RepID=UPI003B217933
MAVQEFVTKQNELLALEREAEIEESSTLLENVSSKELQRRGVCLLKLHISNQSTGLYGRTLLTFELPKGHGDGKLPTHTFSSGDIIGVGPVHGSPSSQVASGIVSRVGTSFITVAFEEQTDELTVDNGQLYQLTKLANDVTYKRIKRALEELESYHAGPASHLIDVLFGDAEVSPPTITQPLDDPLAPIHFYNERLDDSQKEAVQFALAQRDVAIIHGPPGTGKTTTVVEIILQAVRNKLKVLACAPSNVAVDNLVERLVAGKAKVVRLGHPARLLHSIQKYSLDALLDSSDGAKIVQDVRRDMDQTKAKIQKTRDKNERHKLRNEAKFLRKELRERENHVIRDVLTHVDVVLATNTGATSSGPLKQLSNDHFDLVVIDECAQALEASCWISLLKGPRCVLAGDHQQLPPTIISKRAAKDGLALSLMERLIGNHGDKIVRMLTTQYRMHSDIMDWPSAQLYSNKLTAHESVSGHLLKDLSSVTESENTSIPMLLIDTAGCDFHELDLQEELSKGNEGEADLVTLHVKSLIESGVDQSDIAVIAPYNLQVDLLRLRLSNQYPKLEIKSVDGFQGREKEAVVISLVRSNQKGEVGFLSEDRRINVAITRARRHLAVICDSETVSHHEFLKSLIEYLMAKGEVRTAFEYQQDMNSALLDVSRPDYLVFKKQHTTSTEKSNKGARPKQPKTRKQDHGHKTTQHHDRKKPDDKRKLEGSISGKKVTSEDVQESIEDIPGYVELKKQIDEFVADKERSRMEFSSGLTSRERYIVHELAEQTGVAHQSTGEGSERHITVSKMITHAGHKQAKTGNKVDENNKEHSKVTVKELKRAIKEIETENKMSVLAELPTMENEPSNEHSTEIVDNKQVSGNHNNANATRTLYKDDGTLPCKYCGVGLLPGNHLLHEIHCEKIHEEKLQKAKRQQAKRKIDKSKQKQALENTKEEDFDKLIAMAKKADNVCNYRKCKEKITALGQLCEFCNKRYCFSHHIPEVHGCGDMARAKARQITRQQKVVTPGSGKKEKKVDPAHKAHLERKLDAKLSEMGQKRGRKSGKKK